MTMPDEPATSSPHHYLLGTLIALVVMVAYFLSGWSIPDPVATIGMACAYLAIAFMILYQHTEIFTGALLADFGPHPHRKLALVSPQPWTRQPAMTSPAPSMANALAMTIKRSRRARP